MIEHDHHHHFLPLRGRRKTRLAKLEVADRATATPLSLIMFGTAAAVQKELFASFYYDPQC